MGKKAKELADYMEDVFKNEKCSQRTKEMILTFDNNLRRDRRKYSTRWNYFWPIRYFFFWARKPLEMTTKGDVDNYILEITEKVVPKTIECRKQVLKHFFQDNGMGDIVQHLKFIRPPKNKKEKQVLKREELTRIMNFTENIRDRALLAFLFESGCRLSEALAVDVGDLNFDDYGCVFEVKETMKTGSRKIRLVESVPVLKEYLQWHPLRSNKNAPLWIRIGRNPRHRLLQGGVRAILSKIEKMSGTGIHLHSHCFRRSRATELSQVLSNQQLRRFFGWASNEMILVYAQPDDEALDNKIIEINGGQPKRTRKRIPVAKLVRPCPKCGEKHTAGSAFCSNCGLPLSNESIKEYKDNSELRKAIQLLDIMFKRHPSLRKEWDKSIEAEDIID